MDEVEHPAGGSCDREHDPHRLFLGLERVSPCHGVGVRCADFLQPIGMQVDDGLQFGVDGDSQADRARVLESLAS